MDKLFLLKKLFLTCARVSPRGSFKKVFYTALYTRSKDIDSVEDWMSMIEQFEFEGVKYFDYTSKEEYPLKNVDWDNTPGTETLPHTVTVTAESPYPTLSDPFLYIMVFEFGGEKELFFAGKHSGKIVLICANDKYKFKYHVVEAGKWLQAFSKIEHHDKQPKRIASLKVSKIVQLKNMFTGLSPVWNGVGDYHINHFIAFFSADANDPRTSQSAFYRDFCEIFSDLNIATATLHTDKKFKANNTVEFKVGGNLGERVQQAMGLAHHDWVSLQKAPDGKSFYAITLKRNWSNEQEMELQEIMMGGLAELNKFHFLAGRRSWRVGYDAVQNLYYVETAAFERNSNKIYQWIDEHGNLHDDIIHLWVNLLENYGNGLLLPVNALGLDTQKEVGAIYDISGYQVMDHVAYKTGRSDAATDPKGEKLRLTPWFKEVLKRHPGLETDL